MRDVFQMMNGVCRHCPTGKKQSLLRPFTCMDCAATHAFV